MTRFVTDDLIAVQPATKEFIFFSIQSRSLIFMVRGIGQCRLFQYQTYFEILFLSNKINQGKFCERTTFIIPRTNPCTSESFQNMLSLSLLLFPIFSCSSKNRISNMLGGRGRGRLQRISHITVFMYFITIFC